jgi:DNA topoisomerase-1
MKQRNAISRIKKGRKFLYISKNGPIKNKKTVEYIESLSIPPAWDMVTIAGSPNAKVLVTGQDTVGRTQCIYNPKFRARQDKLKFDRILRFADALPNLRRQVTKDLSRKRLVKEKVLACVVRLIDEAYFRVGNEKYAKENQSYGITTMRSKHTDVQGNTVTFDFIGKSGKQHIKSITDRQIANIVKQLDELPGYEVFRYIDTDGKLHDVESVDVNNYIKVHMGEEFSAKDFRTWGGTLLATSELLAVERMRHHAERQKQVVEVVRNVAERLGNTPAVARSSYIDPRVLNAYTESTRLEKIKVAMEKMRPRKYMSRDEQCVLRLLETT